MTKLFFRYGAMNSGKSTAVLQVAHNYEERDQCVPFSVSWQEGPTGAVVALGNDDGDLVRAIKQQLCCPPPALGPFAAPRYGRRGRCCETRRRARRSGAPTDIPVVEWI